MDTWRGFATLYGVDSRLFCAANFGLRTLDGLCRLQHHEEPDGSMALRSPAPGAMCNVQCERRVELLEVFSDQLGHVEHRDLLLAA
ncbi:MAG: hypothetical protein ACREUX_02335, partial [Burkholderiales bacterium]